MSELISASPASPVRIEGWRTVAAEPAALPARRLGLGPFTAVEQLDGSAQLRDTRGEGCGLFVSKHLAERTRAFLER